ncbi:hypothetical protein B0H16DRAFT_211507 [Mycena metata]|uniref:Uncharacterized protein n=1 Tax=Mycena metata TaxID=1033252 RepID=A0AAD7JU52_9AGAR|nr:hypothetical protein B0H16DRAFT_211507 [Mycena metata]
MLSAGTPSVVDAQENKVSRCLSPPPPLSPANASTPARSAPFSRRRTFGKILHQLHPLPPRPSPTSSTSPASSLALIPATLMVPCHCTPHAAAPAPPRKARVHSFLTISCAILSSPSRLPFLDPRPPASSPALTYTAPHPRAPRRESGTCLPVCADSHPHLAKTRRATDVCVPFAFILHAQLPCRSSGVRAEPAQVRTRPCARNLGIYRRIPTFLSLRLLPFAPFPTYILCM